MLAEGTRSRRFNVLSNLYCDIFLNKLERAERKDSSLTPNFKQINKSQYLIEDTVSETK